VTVLLLSASIASVGIVYGLGSLLRMGIACLRPSSSLFSKTKPRLKAPPSPPSHPQTVPKSAPNYVQSILNRPPDHLLTILKPCQTMSKPSPDHPQSISKLFRIISKPSLFSWLKSSPPAIPKPFPNRPHSVFNPSPTFPKSSPSYFNLLSCLTIS
jgi:hypothetical protein